MNKRDLIADGVPMTIAHFDKDGVVTHTESFNLENVHLDRYSAEAIARAILPDIIAYYEDPANIAEFERWQAEQRAKGIPPPKPRKKERRRR